MGLKLKGDESESILHLEKALVVQEGLADMSLVPIDWVNFRLQGVLMMFDRTPFIVDLMTILDLVPCLVSIMLKIKAGVIR
jgi:hypothetical protein